MAEINGLSLKSLTTLKAYYRFESGALTTDSSGNSHTLTAISDPAEDASGNYGGAVALDGNDAYSILAHADLQPTTEDFSFSGWVKTSSTSAVIFQNLNIASGGLYGYYFYVSSAGKLTFLTCDGDGSALITLNSTTSINTNTWTHVAATRSGNVWTVYVDGVADGTVTQAGTIAYHATMYPRIGCLIATDVPTPEQFLTGSIDDLAFWNGTALTADQVAALYSSTIQTVTLTASADNMLASDAATTNYGNEVIIDVGEWTTQLRRSLVKFDLSARSASDTFKSAVLKLYDTAGDLSSNARVMSAYRVLRAWVEGESTWNIYSTGNNWATAGCANTTSDRESTVLGSITMPATEVAQYYGFDLTAGLVQDWVDGGLTNNGLLLQMATENEDMHEFSSSEAASNKPQLIIDYEPAPLSPGGSVFLNLL